MTDNPNIRGQIDAQWVALEQDHELHSAAVAWLKSAGIISPMQEMVAAVKKKILEFPGSMKQQGRVSRLSLYLWLNAENKNNKIY